jgi:Tfp pilus assembly protein PilX
MKKNIWIIRGERGTTLIVTLAIMVILVLIGIAALTTSSIDLRIAGNERVQKQAFNWAEAGLDFGQASPPDSWVTIYNKGTGSTKDYRQDKKQYEVTVTYEYDISMPRGAKSGQNLRAYVFRINSNGYGGNLAQSQIEMRGWVASIKNENY